MDRPFHIGLDLDGVFADFNTAALDLLHELFGPPRNEDWEGPTTWNWWSDAGYKASESDTLWKVIRDPASQFWLRRVAPYRGAPQCLKALINGAMDRGLAFTFLTTRPGRTARPQSIEWLRRYVARGWAPQVICCPNAEGKGRIAAGMQLDAFIDDSWPNVQAVQRHTQLPGKHLAVYHRPWTAATLPPREPGDPVPDPVWSVDGYDNLFSWVEAIRAPMLQDLPDPGV
jgi:5' nucleotidase, deoxy (Pyrimidine), cytosolic type C protein (NT5C)